MITRVSILMCMACAATANAADVRLRSAAVCGGSIVRVADVAEVFGDDHRLAQSLADLPLGALGAKHLARRKTGKN